MSKGLGGYRPGHRGPSAVRLVWVYPDLLSTYGDRGNLLVLARRARLRGFGVEIAEVNSDQRVPADGDIYLLGGGEDLPQILAARRLAGSGPGAGLAAAAARGAVVFAVCAGYQIVGREFAGAEGEPVPGLGLLDIRSERGERRGVGEIVADVDPALGAGQADRFREPPGRDPARTGGEAPGQRRHRRRQRGRDGRRVRRPGARYLPARACPGPQPGPGRPAARLGRRLAAAGRPPAGRTSAPAARRTPGRPGCLRLATRTRTMIMASFGRSSARTGHDHEKLARGGGGGLSRPGPGRPRS